MITVIANNNIVRVEGHAGYAPCGRDIVCAAISALTETFIASAEQLTSSTIKYDIKPGLAQIEIEDDSEAIQLLKTSFFVGCQMVADEYPAYVQVTKP